MFILLIILGFVCSTIATELAFISTARLSSTSPSFSYTDCFLFIVIRVKQIYIFKPFSSFAEHCLTASLRDSLFFQHHFSNPTAILLAGWSLPCGIIFYRYFFVISPFPEMMTGKSQYASHDRTPFIESDDNHTFLRSLDQFESLNCPFTCRRSISFVSSHWCQWAIIHSCLLILIILVKHLYLTPNRGYENALVCYYYDIHFF